MLICTSTIEKHDVSWWTRRMLMHIVAHQLSLQAAAAKAQHPSRSRQATSATTQCLQHRHGFRNCRMHTCSLKTRALLRQLCLK